MGVYLGLIALLLCLSLLIKAGIRDKKRQECAILTLSMMALFLLLSLKSTWVGTDMPGYRAQYELAGRMPFWDFSYVYFEKGYLLVSKLFSKGGVPFPIFTAAVYALLFRAYHAFLHRYSQNTTLSVLILICYQFLVFHISGLRQTLAMAVCIWAFLVLERSMLLSLCLTALAASFHTSALIFFAVYPISTLRKRPKPLTMLLLAVPAALCLRPVLWMAVSRYLPQIETTGIRLGGNCLFLGLMALFLCFTQSAYPEGGWQAPFFCRMAVLAFAADLLLSGSTLLRGNLFFTLFLLPGIPNAIRRYEPRVRLCLELALGGFLILLFYFQTLSINQLDLLPYRFFWQQ